MSIRIKDATPIEELQDQLLFAVGNTEGDTDGCISLGQTKDFIDADKAQVAFTGSYLNLSDTPNLEAYVLMTTLNTNYYNKNQINQLIGGVSGPKFEKVEELPEQGENNIIYLIPDETAQQDNIFDEYVWIPDGRIFEKIGSTEADFDNYYTMEEVDALIPSVNNYTITLQQGGVTKGSFTLNQSSAATINFDESFVQEQADWNESDPSAVEYIKNKPTIPEVNDPTITFTQGGVTKGSFTLNQSTADTIEFEKPYQSDWTVEDPNDQTYIQNKPDTMELEFTYDDGIVENIEFYVGNRTKRREYFYVKNTYEGQNTVTIKIEQTSGISYYTNSYEYSKDKENWTLESFTRNGGTFTYTLEEGESLYLRNNNYTWSYLQGAFGYGRTINIKATQKHNVGGDIQSLTHYTTTESTQYPMYEGAFASMFEGNTTLESAADLKLSSYKLTSNAYYHMFYGCTNLVHGPKFTTNINMDGYSSTGQRACEFMFYGCTNLYDIPDFTIETTASRSFYGMFCNCSSLTKIKPKLNATELKSQCYNIMFANCSSMTTTPDLSKATTLATECYRSMLAGTAITTAPSLPVTTLKTWCYAGLFANCQNLTTAPSLPATTLDNYCYYQMFSGSGLTTAPELPATTLTERCYSQMFRNCSNIDEITIYADDISATDCLTDWLDGVAQSGTFHNLGSATYTTGSASGIPSGWTETNS